MQERDRGSVRLSLVRWPDEGLSRPCRPVASFDSELADLIGAMHELMHAEGGIGLAAPQVGSDLAVFVTAQLVTGPTTFVNPDVVLAGEHAVATEGCLSFGKIEIQVRRSSSCTVTACHADGTSFGMQIDGRASKKHVLMSRCIQHEFDHVMGLTFLNRADPAARLMALQELMRRGR